MTQLLTPEELLLQSGELYTLPAIAMEVLALADDPTLQPTALKRCFERDPAACHFDSSLPRDPLRDVSLRNAFLKTSGVT